MCRLIGVTLPIRLRPGHRDSSRQLAGDRLGSARPDSRPPPHKSTPLKRDHRRDTCTGSLSTLGPAVSARRVGSNYFLKRDPLRPIERGPAKIQTTATTMAAPWTPAAAAPEVGLISEFEPAGARSGRPDEPAPFRFTNSSGSLSDSEEPPDSSANGTTTASMVRSLFVVRRPDVN